MKAVATGDLVIYPGLTPPPDPSGWTRLHEHCCWFRIAAQPTTVSDDYDVHPPASVAAGAFDPGPFTLEGLTRPHPSAAAEAPAEGVCGPFICAFPKAQDTRPGTRWTCPRCGSTYRLTRPRGARWWRNWSAPYGQWVLVWPGLRGFLDEVRAR